MIRVLDVNDCRPQFSRPQFSTSVYENEPAGTSVITMMATDQDEGSNGQLAYSLEGPGMGTEPALDNESIVGAGGAGREQEGGQGDRKAAGQSCPLSRPVCQRPSTWTWTRAW